ncbi:MAG TPA: metal-dependent transcriptional regulator [Candidatus Dormibacteraeota bacterium]|nr:metal-dependent transcriptional regulator [Candidatus Dormibacteraeota bacterium]
MPRDKSSASREDYLKAIWESVQEGQTPISARLAKDLEVTPPAVTAALKRMARDGYLRVARDGQIGLTAKGRQAAEHLVLRHRLAEKLLTEVLGLNWTAAHEEAERLEHAISPQVETLLLDRFGRDSVCPHGVPLFGGLRVLRRQGAVTLAEAEVGDELEIMHVWEKDKKFLEFVDSLRLRPGAHLTVRAREYDQTMSLVAADRPHRLIHLGLPATSRIWVRRISR